MWWWFDCGELSKFKETLDEDYIIAVGEDASSSDGAPLDDLKVPLIFDDDGGGDCMWGWRSYWGWLSWMWSEWYLEL